MEPGYEHIDGRLVAARFTISMSAMGRKHQFAASGSSRWSDIFAKCLECPSALSHRRAVPSYSGQPSEASTKVRDRRP